MQLDICIVTSSRADWGLFRAPARLIKTTPAFRLQIIAAGTHLSPRHGMTIDDIHNDGFAVDFQVPIFDETGDDAPAVIRAMARMTAGMGEALAALQPDLVLLLGDRYEILCAAQACLIARAPVAHLFGGDITEGAFDDSIRHSITKLAHLHFVSNAPAARRLERMGEQPERIVIAGSPGLDSIRLVPALDRAATFAALGLVPRKHNLLVTFHPATLDEVPGETQFEELAAALDALGPDTGVILTGSNADPEGQRLTQRAEAFAAARPNAVFRVSLGQKLYFSAMRHVNAVVGNSSSGLYEAPSFGVATVNIGERQTGRIRAASVFDVAPERGAIGRALAKALAGDFRSVVNPYGDGYASERIVSRLAAITRPADLLVKRFYEGS